MPLAVEREKRQNAGSRMAKLLNEEEEDDFYKTAYGGFAEVCNIFLFLDVLRFLVYVNSLLLLLLLLI